MKIINLKWHRVAYTALVLMFLLLISGCKAPQRNKRIEIKAEFNCVDAKQITQSEELKEFRSLYLEKRNYKLSKKDSQFLVSSNEAKSWYLFEQAVLMLQNNKNREKAQYLFNKVATEYPQTFYFEKSKELSSLLLELINEDKAWEEPKQISHLTINEKIEYHIFHLRNISAEQQGQPLLCSVFDTEPGDYNPASSLVEIGRPAIPYLINLLDDRRPLSTMAYWRDFYPTRKVLRYQDAAIEILSRISGEHFYLSNCTSCYFSTESCNIRKESWFQAKKWYNKT